MDQKVGVVTGAGGDIGRAVCEALAKRGAKVLCVDLTEKLAEEGAAAARAEQGEAFAIPADVSNEGDAQKYAARARQLWGRADFFFNNAGIEGAEAPLAEYPVEAWDRVLAVNLRGVFLGLKSMLPLLRGANGPHVVNTSSVAGLQGTPNLAAYGASKHAVIGLTKTAALEFAADGIAVNALCPGPVTSEMMRRIEEGVAPGASEQAHSGYEQMVPQHRYATLTEVADLAVYMLLDAPLYMTGQAIALDGGLTAA